MEALRQHYNMLAYYGNNTEKMAAIATDAAKTHQSESRRTERRTPRQRVLYLVKLVTLGYRHALHTNVLRCYENVWGSHRHNTSREEPGASLKHTGALYVRTAVFYWDHGSSRYVIGCLYPPPDDWSTPLPHSMFATCKPLTGAAQHSMFLRGRDGGSTPRNTIGWRQGTFWQPRLHVL